MQVSEQKVKVLIGSLEKLRHTVPQPSSKIIVDIVQSINEARRPEPSGRISDFSVLFVSILTSCLASP